MQARTAPTQAMKPAPHADAERLRDAIGRTMSAHYLVMKTLEKTDACTREQIFGFGPEDVVEVHRRKRGVGRGFWYRLADGRVFDALGRPSPPTRSCYPGTA